MAIIMARGNSQTDNPYPDEIVDSLILGSRPTGATAARVHDMLTAVFEETAQARSHGSHTKGTMAFASSSMSVEQFLIVDQSPALTSAHYMER